MDSVSFGLSAVHVVNVLELANEHIMKIKSIRDKLDNEKVKTVLDKHSIRWKNILLEGYFFKVESIKDAERYLSCKSLWWKSRKYQTHYKNLKRIRTLGLGAIKNDKDTIYLSDELLDSLYNTEYKFTE